MNNFTIGMGLMDYIPVIFFGVTAVLLLRDLYNKMVKGAYALLAAGCVNVFMAGFCKATWKLLYAAGICNFEALDHMFFPVQSIGFLLAGIGILAMIAHKQTKCSLMAAAPPVFTGTFVFVGLMVAGLGILDTVLCILAVKLKKPGLIAVFVLSFVCSLCMGYLSSQDFAQASMNWIAEGVNAMGQGTMLLGTILLHRNGLVNLKLHGGEKA